MKKLIFLVFILLSHIAIADTNTALPNADKVLVEKSIRKMYLIKSGVKYKEYNILLGDNPVGPKVQEGDERTPEGLYVIDYRNPNSHYHLSLHISYPNKEDRRKAQEMGVNPGGNIFIHGLPNGMDTLPLAFRDRDWTDGCIALTNEEIKQFWTLVKNGTPIEIRP